MRRVRTGMEKWRPERLTEQVMDWIELVSGRKPVRDRLGNGLAENETLMIRASAPFRRFFRPTQALHQRVSVRFYSVFPVLPTDVPGQALAYLIDCRIVALGPCCPLIRRT